MFELGVALRRKGLVIFMKKNTILIVDDMEINRMILQEILCDDYEILQAASGTEALRILFDTSNPLPEVILLDIMMPEMDGYETIDHIKKNKRTKEITVLFITAADTETNEAKALQAGAMDYIKKPFIHEVVKARVDNHVMLSNYRRNLESMVEEKTRELSLMHQRTLDTLASIIEYRDLESGLHVQRTTELTKVLVENMLDKPIFREELINQNYRSIVKAVALHDIGKVGIPDEILLKPGRLTPEEFDIIKKHSRIGGNIINAISKDMNDDTKYLQHCRDICLYHHEKWDGSGYPLNLKGEEIPLSARIIAVVDVYDALTSKRCYKDACPYSEAVEIIEKGKGTHFQPEVVDCFLEVSKKFRELTLLLQDGN